MYKNEKVSILLGLTGVESDLFESLEFTEQDFADLAIAAADQAGMSARDQSLFEQLLTAAVAERKNARGAKR